MDASAIGQHNLHELAYWGLRFREAKGNHEQAWKLKGYARLAKAREALLKEDGKWRTLLLGALQAGGEGSNPGLKEVVGWQAVDRFKKWMLAHPAEAERILRDLWAPNAPWPASMEASLESLSFLTPGLRLKLVSVLGGAVDPERRVPYKERGFRDAYRRSGYAHEPVTDGLNARYQHALGFLDAVTSAAAHHGASITRLEAHDLVWYAIGGGKGYRAPDSWTATELAALQRFRGEPEGPVSLSQKASEMLARLEQEDVTEEPPEDGEEERERVLRSVALRRGQAKFRNALLVAYEGRCAVTGSDCEAVLEAAHIMPVAAGGADTVNNGVLLRADIHTLFDLGLLAIDVSSWTTILSPDIRHGAYAELHGAAFRVPQNVRDAPSTELLASRRAECNF
jgi:hypothetical protein